MAEQKRILIDAGVKLLSKSEVLKYISNKTYNDIKAKDTDPMFVVTSLE